MSNDVRERQNREADPVREVDRLRVLLKQAGIDAEQSLRETEASERRHGRDVAEERTRAEAARADADEISHRLKNVLAVVQAIENATLKPGVPMEDARAAFNSRLEALARVHDILFQSNWATASLRTIVDGILPLTPGGGGGRTGFGQMARKSALGPSLRWPLVCLA
jgi:two-component sensor histidine kinase